MNRLSILPTCPFITIVKMERLSLLESLSPVRGKPFVRQTRALFHSTGKVMRLNIPYWHTPMGELKRVDPGWMLQAEVRFLEPLPGAEVEATIVVWGQCLGESEVEKLCREEGVLFPVCVFLFP